MNEFDRNHLKSFLAGQSELERVRRLFEKQDRLKSVVDGSSAVGSLISQQAQAALKAFEEREQLHCLTRALRADQFQGIGISAAADILRAQIESQEAERLASFRAYTGENWIQGLAQKEMERFQSITKAASNAGVLGLHKALEERQHPWISAMDAAASVRGFAELQVLGAGLKVVQPFSDQFTLAAREMLGDWTAVSKIPEVVYMDATARSAFYLKQGYDPALADLPSRAFDESLYLAGLDDHHAQDVDETEEQAAKRRTSDAQATISEFEREMRQFIQKRMTERLGADWMKQRIDGKVLKGWKEKQRYDQAARKVEHPLLDYADFTEYEPIIVRGDNWTIFQPYFRRKESVQESFYRLRPLRIAAMHSRLLTQDDCVFLNVEIKRLRIAMSLPNEPAEDNEE